MPNKKTNFIFQAKDVLQQNFTGVFTKPAPSLYPHQWNWDTGFIAIGYSHFDTQRALNELHALFKAQWSTGMLPQILFRPDPNARYFPSADFWASHLSENAPKNVATSGITMPPVQGFTLWHIFKNAQNPEPFRTQFEELFSKILHAHQYLYNLRDPQREGLPYIRHPWASGTDNSPTWDGIIDQIDFENLEITPYKRQDLKGDNAEFRPTDRDYDFYVHLLDIYKKHRYDDKAIEAECPFLIQDPLFISILAHSNECMIELGKWLGRDTAQFKEWNDQTVQSAQTKLWEEDRGVFGTFDLKNNTLIPTYTSSGLMPLFGGLPSEAQAKKMIETLKSPRFSGSENNPAYLCPTYDLTRPDLNPKKYWRGPIWVNMNWLLYHGLERYGYGKLAEQLKQDTLHLIETHDFSEYYNPFKHTTGRVAYGTDIFSWTAALYLDFCLNDESKTL